MLLPGAPREERAPIIFDMYSLEEALAESRAEPKPNDNVAEFHIERILQVLGLRARPSDTLQDLSTWTRPLPRLQRLGGLASRQVRKIRETGTGD